MKTEMEIADKQVGFLQGRGTRDKSVGFMDSKENK